MKDLKELGVELYLKGKEGEIKCIPKDSSLLPLYRRVMAVIQEGVRFSGFSMEGIALGSEKNIFYIVDRGKEHIGLLTDRYLNIEDIENIEKAIIKEPEEVPEKAKKPAEVAREKVEEKTLSPDVLEKIEGILNKYLGAFAHPVFENQLKQSKLDLNYLQISRVRKFVFNLQNAAGMIIGPSQSKVMAQEMMNLLVQ